NTLINRNRTRETEPKRLLAGKAHWPLANRHYNAVDVLSLNQRSQFRSQVDDFGIDEALSQQGRIVVDKANNSKAGVLPSQSFARDLNCERAGANNENALAKFRMTQHPMNCQAPDNHQQQRRRQ